MAKELSYYHSPQEVGFWTDKSVFERDIRLNDGRVLTGVIPIGIREQDDTLVMVLSTFEGVITEPIDNFLGLIVVRGDSQHHLYEKDGELLIEFDYYKINHMEDKPRRIRPAGIMFGIFGDTNKESAAKGGHRAMGESADYYLEGIDTQYDPAVDSNRGLRRFPFWRSGVWGNPVELAREYLPLPPAKGE